MNLIEKRRITTLKFGKQAWFYKDVFVDVGAYGAQCIQNTQPGGWPTFSTENCLTKNLYLGWRFRNSDPFSKSHGHQFQAALQIGEWNLGVPLEHCTVKTLRDHRVKYGIDHMDDAVFVDVVDFMKNPERVFLRLRTVVWLYPVDASYLRITKSLQFPLLGAGEIKGREEYREIRGSVGRISVETNQKTGKMVKTGTEIIRDFADEQWDDCWWVDEAIHIKDILSRTPIMMMRDGICSRTVCVDFPLQLVEESFGAMELLFATPQVTGTNHSSHT